MRDSFIFSENKNSKAGNTPFRDSSAIGSNDVPSLQDFLEFLKIDRLWEKLIHAVGM